MNFLWKQFLIYIYIKKGMIGTCWTIYLLNDWHHFFFWTFQEINLLPHTRPFQLTGFDLFPARLWDVHSDSCASSRMTSRESCPQRRCKLHWTWKCLFSESDNDAWRQSVRYFCELEPGHGLKTCWRHAGDKKKSPAWKDFPVNNKNQQALGATKQINCCLSVSCERDTLARDPPEPFDLDPCWRQWAAALVEVIYQTQHCRGSQWRTGKDGDLHKKPSAVLERDWNVCFCLPLVANIILIINESARKRGIPRQKMEEKKNYFFPSSSFTEDTRDT